ncbi:hypothetical protein D3C72_1458300 [compost metagenome]
MDVRRALADGIDQDLVDELHHRGIVALGVDAAVGAGHVVVATANIEVGHAVLVAPQRIAHGVVAGMPLLQRAAYLVLVHQDRFNHQIGVELDLIQRVGGVAGADEQLAAAFEQRQHVVLAQQLLADQAHRVLAAVERGHVEQRHAELDRVGGRELGSADHLVLGEPSWQRLARSGGLGHGVAGGDLIQRAVLDQATGQAGDADEIGGGNDGHMNPWLMGLAVQCALRRRSAGQQNLSRPNGRRHRQSMSNAALPGVAGPAGPILTPPGMIAPSTLR